MQGVDPLYIAKLSGSQSASTSVTPLGEVEAVDHTVSADKGRFCLKKYIAWLKLDHLQTLAEVTNKCKEQWRMYAQVFTEGSSGGVLFVEDEDRPLCVVATDDITSSINAIDSVPVSTIPDVKAKLARLHDVGWVFKRCAHEVVLLGFDLRVIFAMEKRCEISALECDVICANLLGYLDDVDGETSEKVVKAQHKKARRQAQFLVRQGTSYQQIPLINLIPVTHFRERDLQTGKVQKGMVALHRLLMEVTAAAAAAPAAAAVAWLPPAAAAVAISCPETAAATQAQVVLLAGLINVTSDAVGLSMVTGDAIMASKSLLKAALDNFEIEGGLCDLLGKSIDESASVDLDHLLLEYVSPAQRKLQERRLHVLHNVGAKVTFFAPDGKKFDAEVEHRNANGGNYTVFGATQAWETSGAHLESREKLVSSEDTRLQERRLEVVHEKGAMVTFFLSRRSLARHPKGAGR